MNRLVTAAAALEAITGITLLIAPAMFVELLLHAPLDGAGVVAARIAGAALCALGIACVTERHSSVGGLLIYNAIVACYLLGLGIDGRYVGVLLWPGVALHVVLALLLLYRLFTVPSNTKG